MRNLGDLIKYAGHCNVCNKDVQRLVWVKGVIGYHVWACPACALAHGVKVKLCG